MKKLVFDEDDQSRTIVQISDSRIYIGYQFSDGQEWLDDPEAEASLTWEQLDEVMRAAGKKQEE